ncbi:MAG: M15 family metallopeptidase [Turicibacter sp.]|nr:M15 family metallopeptidase [Turicibacter sp.]
MVNMLKIGLLGTFLFLWACTQASPVELEEVPFSEPSYHPREEAVLPQEIIVPEPVPNPVPNPVQFCGQADHAGASILSDEEALSYLALVNRCQRASNSFEPRDLSPVNVESLRVRGGTHHLMRSTAARAVEDMFQEAALAGHRIIASSGYRSYELQTLFFYHWVSRYGRAEAMRFSAVPGHSEHQLGLALDLSTVEFAGGLYGAFITTPEGLWVRDNAHRFGFIVSYPEGREAETGFIYEPWHIRYVGVEAATIIYENNWILEEYLWYQEG